MQSFKGRMPKSSFASEYRENREEKIKGGKEDEKEMQRKQASEWYII